MSFVQNTTASRCREQAVPVVIKHVTLETHLGTIEKTDQNYHNVLVSDEELKLIKYVLCGTCNFIRQTPVERYDDDCLCWPDHPLDITGRIQGAIAIIRSLDDHILLVRNRNLWGFPKGARNFSEFTRLKSLTDMHYLTTGHILTHDQASFTYDSVESSIDNVCREVKEETGIIIDTKHLEPFKCRYAAHGSYCAYDGYLYKYPRLALDYVIDLQNNGTDHENDELLWVTRDVLEHMYYTHRCNMDKIFNHVTFGYLDEYMMRI